MSVDETKRRNRKRLDFRNYKTVNVKIHTQIASHFESYLTVWLDGHRRICEKLHVLSIRYFFKLKFEITHSQMRESHYCRCDAVMWVWSRFAVCVCDSISIDFSLENMWFLVAPPRSFARQCVTIYQLLPFLYNFDNKQWETIIRRGRKTFFVCLSKCIHAVVPEGIGKREKKSKGVKERVSWKETKNGWRFFSFKPKFCDMWSK